jgi:hypothetical protein
MSKKSYEDVLQYGIERFGTEEAFKTAFSARLDVEFPADVNAGQRVMVVAKNIDDNTAAVIEYLSDTYRVPINAVSFDLVSHAGETVFVRHFVLDQAAVPQPSTSKKRPSRTLEEFKALAEANGVGEQFEHLLLLRNVLPMAESFVTSYALKAQAPDKRVLAGVSIYPTAETNVGTIDVNLYRASLASLYGITDSERMTAALDSLAPNGAIRKQYEGWDRLSLTTLEQVDAFVAYFSALARTPPTVTEPSGEVPA